MYPSAQPLVNPYSLASSSSGSSYPSCTNMAAPASASSLSMSSSSSSLAGARPDFTLRRSRSDSSNSTASSISSNATAIASSSSNGNGNSSSSRPLGRSLSTKDVSLLNAPPTAQHLTVEAPSKSSERQVQLRPVIFEEEYQDEVIEHMREMESASLANLELMNAQPELRWFMRPYLVDFIVEIHQTFRLRPETLYLTMNIADRYVSKRIVFKRHYQLVGSAALLIASKYEDAKDRVPTIADLSLMCCQAYDESAFLQMEGHILQTLQWQLGHPTPEAWLRTLCMQSAEETATQNVARFLMEVTLFHRNFIGVPSSLIASGALMLARYICLQEPRKYLATSDLGEVTSIAQMIDGHVAPHLDELSLILVKKYGYQHFSAASTIVKNFYTAGQAARGDSATSALTKSSSMPGHALSMTSSTSSDSMDDRHDCSMDTSDSSTPSSMSSTPSRYRGGTTDDDDEDEEDEDMPVTPLTSQNDPMASTSTSARMSPSRMGGNKENQAVHPHAFRRTASMGSNCSDGSVDGQISLGMKRSQIHDKIPSITVQHVHANGTAATGGHGSRPALISNHTWQPTT